MRSDPFRGKTIVGKDDVWLSCYILAELSEIEYILVFKGVNICRSIPLTGNAYGFFTSFRVACGNFGSHFDCFVPYAVRVLCDRSYKSRVFTVGIFNPIVLVGTAVESGEEYIGIFIFVLSDLCRYFVYYAFVRHVYCIDALPLKRLNSLSVFAAVICFNLIDYSYIITAVFGQFGKLVFETVMSVYSGSGRIVLDDT